MIYWSMTPGKLVKLDPNLNMDSIGLFNPKRPRLFGLLDTQGGGLTHPNFIFEQQTESHVKAEALS